MTKKTKTNKKKNLNVDSIANKLNELVIADQNLAIDFFKAQSQDQRDECLSKHEKQKELFKEILKDLDGCNILDLFKE